MTISRPWVVSDITRIAEALGVHSDTVRDVCCRIPHLAHIRQSVLRADQMASTLAIYPSDMEERILPEGELLYANGLHTPRILTISENKEDDFDFQTCSLEDVYARIQFAQVMQYCITLADIQHYEKYSDLIPKVWDGRRIYAWRSVIKTSGGPLKVAYLECGSSIPRVWWVPITTTTWYQNEVLGMKAEHITPQLEERLSTADFIFV
jgi:hypothetical protein